MLLSGLPDTVVRVGDKQGDLGTGNRLQAGEVVTNLGEIIAIVIISQFSAAFMMSHKTSF